MFSSSYVKFWDGMDFSNLLRLPFPYHAVFPYNSLCFCPSFSLPHLLKFHSQVATYALSGLVCVTCVCLMIFIFANSAHAAVKSASWPLSMFVLVCLSLMAAGASLYAVSPERGAWVCSLRQAFAGERIQFGRRVCVFACVSFVCLIICSFLHFFRRFCVCLWSSLPSSFVSLFRCIVPLQPPRSFNTYPPCDFHYHFHFCV